MKVCTVQPHYSFEFGDCDVCFRELTALADQCDESMDLIVLPEYCDIPAAAENAAGFHASIEKYNDAICQKAAETARRCHAIVCANFACRTETGERNTTFVFDRDGQIVGKYYKAHPAPSEVKTAAQGGNEMDCSYSYRYEPPYVVEIEGIRFGFMTCYDFYMYEGFAALARQNVDIIIGCSHQRTDTHNALDVIGRFLCYNTNAYLVRAAVSLGADSPVCGCSMVVSPKGEMLMNMKNEVGLGCCEIDPQDKYFKPAGFHGAPKAHWQYIDEGRRPWLYRPGGSMMVPGEDSMTYPRICAHRGFNTIAPENSLPAFGAAIALGADEIEFDLWFTKDKEIVSIHDAKLDRVSDGEGKVYEHTYEELLQYDFGKKAGEKFAGMRIIKFEDILQKFACHCVMNIHIKSIKDTPYDDDIIDNIVALIDQYDCRKNVYFMTGDDDLMEKLSVRAPGIARCMGGGPVEKRWDIVERAKKYGCQKVQFFKPFFNQQMIDKAHANGMRCNVFWADDPEEACRYLDMGIDTILTNDYLQVANATASRRKAKK